MITNNDKFIDLHVHSSCSDGTLTPSELVSLAIKCGLSAFALTDHDTTEGIDEALKAAVGTGLTVVPGIEISCRFDGPDIHMLGFGIDYNDEEFKAAITRLKNSRSGRNLRVIQKMRDEGIDITPEKLIEKYGDASITRAHFAAYLTDIGFVKNRAEAFEKYLNPGRIFYIPKEQIEPEEAIRLIHDAKGRAVLAHPLLYRLDGDGLDKLIARLKKAGLDGMEVIYSLNTGDDEIFLRRLAEKHNLFITGGSDFHGANKPDINLGTGRVNNTLRVPYELLKNVISPIGQ